MTKNGIVAVAMSLLLAACGGDKPQPTPQADEIFYGGAIITMDPAQPDAQAVAVKDGRIMAVGDSEEVMRYRGDTTDMTDLKGAALLPGFIDTHGHLLNVANTLQWQNLAPPPAGPAADMDSLVQAMRDYIEKNQIPAGEWVIGFNYDDSQLAEKRQPTRDDLDRISTEHPIVIAHVSFHLGVVNSAALQQLGLTAESPDPEGGVIVRKPDSREPNGVLEESGFWHAVAKLPFPDAEASMKLLQKTQNYYASFGITTAQEGAASPDNVELYKKANQEGKLKLDIVAYPVVGEAMEGVLARGDTPSRDYQGHFRIGGIKMILDGSPQGRTAWLSQPYFHPPHDLGPDYHGYPAMTDETVNQRVSDAADKGWQLLAHANGDAAAQQMLDALAAAGTPEKLASLRPVMIHAQTVREDQLDRMRTLGVIPSFYVAHTFFWGDWHRDVVLGDERAERISPAQSALARGLHFTFHNDSPVVPPEMMRLVWNGVTRQTRSGEILGPGQRVSVMDALRAITLDAAYQYFEEDQKGSITTGKRADLVILAANPLTVDTQALRDLQVLRTIKDGTTIYQRQQP